MLKIESSQLDSVQQRRVRGFNESPADTALANERPELVTWLLVRLRGIITMKLIPIYLRLTDISPPLGQSFNILNIVYT